MKQRYKNVLWQGDNLLKKHKIFGIFRKNCVICAA